MLYFVSLQDHVEYFRSKFGKKPLKKSYFKHAMEHFRDECETEKIAFLYVSDDMEWGKQELAKVQKKHQDIFFVGKLKIISHFHSLQMCNFRLGQRRKRCDWLRYGSNGLK